MDLLPSVYGETAEIDVAESRRDAQEAIFLSTKPPQKSYPTPEATSPAQSSLKDESEQYQATEDASWRQSELSSTWEKYEPPEKATLRLDNVPKEWGWRRFVTLVQTYVDVQMNGLTDLSPGSSEASRLMEVTNERHAKMIVERLDQYRSLGKQGQLRVTLVSASKELLDWERAWGRERTLRAFAVFERGKANLEDEPPVKVDDYLRSLMRQVSEPRRIATTIPQETQDGRRIRLSNITFATTIDSLRAMVESIGGPTSHGTFSKSGTSVYFSLESKVAAELVCHKLRGVRGLQVENCEVLLSYWAFRRRLSFE